MTNAQKNAERLPLLIKENRPVLKRIRAQARSKDGELALNFFYSADDRIHAEGLRKHLIDSRGYRTDISVRPGSTGEHYSVFGQTPPVLVDNSILDDWVRAMSDAGTQFDCEFDGWGSSLSSIGVNFGTRDSNT